MRRLVLLFAVPFLLATGCGDDKKSSGGGGGGGGSPTGATCLFPAESCYVAFGVTFTPTDLTNLGAACTGSVPTAGTFTPSGTCSTASTVPGYCQYPDTSGSGVTIPGATARGYFYTPAYNATTAGLECTAGGGTWTGGTAPLCGNGTVNAPEVCDGANLNGQTCISRGFTGGTLACAANCLSFVTTGCTGGGGGTCGNGTLDLGEVCDVGNLSGETCTLNGFSGGTLACAANCLNFNTISCTGGPAGWRCDPSYYNGADGCDCGCGIVDPDCASSASSACDWCTEVGSCAPLTGSCPSNINTANNAICN